MLQGFPHHSERSRLPAAVWTDLKNFNVPKVRIHLCSHAPLRLCPTLRIIIEVAMAQFVEQPKNDDYRHLGRPLALDRRSILEHRARVAFAHFKTRYSVSRVPKLRLRQRAEDESVCRSSSLR
jgi:hypothetical protein